MVTWFATGIHELVSREKMIELQIFEFGEGSHENVSLYIWLSTCHQIEKQFPKRIDIGAFI